MDTYFRVMQVAQRDVELLDLPIPDKLLMQKTTMQLKAYLGTTEGPKAASRWSNKRRKDELVLLDSTDTRF